MALTVSSVAFNVRENSRKHFTDFFELSNRKNPVPILRRGQAFLLTLRFERRNYVKNKDTIKIIFTLGPNPHATRNTLGALFLEEKDELGNDEWLGRIISCSESKLEAEIISPSDIPFGAYTFKIETLYDNYRNVYEHEEKLYFLFNPWLKGDLVYMGETQDLDEYILADVGKIWLGPMQTTKGREWVYGQYAKCVLPACCFLLDRAGIPYHCRGDPIKMVRAISRIVNSNDDSGVLYGRWDGVYEDGTAPSAWTGSDEILQKYFDTQKEVKYGQCWVFAGVVTAVCRAIGIPCRPVSNVVSAHDTNCSLTVDKFYNENNEELKENTEGVQDSVWNYHVWNEVYMARPDLPKGYGGWQCIDATPQETSDGLFQCGPASVEAVRRGEVGFNYDVGFILSSVNADFVQWKLDKSAPLGFRRVHCETDRVGKMIITKRAFSFDPNGEGDREDITEAYKYKEGTQAERLSLYNAVRNSRNAKRYFDVSDEIPAEVEFELNDLEKISIGESFTSFIKVTNHSQEVRTVQATLSAKSVYYTGNQAEDIKQVAGTITLFPTQRYKLQMLVTPKDYLGKLVEYNNVKVHAICSVKKTKQTWAAEDDFQIITPNIEIENLTSVQVGEPNPHVLSLKNPLHQHLENCYFNISCPRILKETMKVKLLDIPPGKTIAKRIGLSAKTPGTYKVVATFVSKQMIDVTGSAVFEVI